MGVEAARAVPAMIELNDVNQRIGKTPAQKEGVVPNSTFLKKSFRFLRIRTPLHGKRVDHHRNSRRPGSGLVPGVSEIAAWRRKPGGAAPIFSIYLTVRQHLVSQVASHVVNVLVSDRDQFPPELGGFQIEVAIFDESLSLHLDLKVFPALHSGVPDSTG